MNDAIASQRSCSQPPRSLQGETMADYHADDLGLRLVFPPEGSR